MTELEAAQKFKVEINKLDRSSLIDVRIEKVLHYLNKAALFLVKKKYKGNDPGPGRLETMHPVLDDLKVLLKEATTDVADGLSPNTPVPFETDHLYYISSRIKTVCAKTGNSAWHEGRYVKPERVYKEQESPFNKSKFDDPMVTISDNKLVVYNEGFDIDEWVTIKYLKAPNLITGSSADQMELPFADEIIDIAVAMALENFESQRIKTQPGINVVSASE